MGGLGPIIGEKPGARLTPLLVSLLLVWLLALPMSGTHKFLLHDDASWPVLRDPTGQAKLLPSRSSIVCGIRSDEGSSDPPHHCLATGQYEPLPSSFQALSTSPAWKGPNGWPQARRTSARPREPPIES
jgi:hypothetical protein